MRLLFALSAVLFCFVAAAHVGQAQAPTVPAVEKEITSIEDPLDALPRDLLTELKGSKQDEAMMKATDLLQKNVEGRTITLKATVDHAEKLRTPPNAKVKKDKYRFKIEDERLKRAGLPINSLVWVNLAEEENEKVALLKAGAKVTFTGRVQVASLTRGNPMRLHLVVTDAKLK